MRSGNVGYGNIVVYFKNFLLRDTLASIAHVMASVIWQKGESQNGGNTNTKHAKFSEKRTFFTL